MNQYDLRKCYKKLKNIVLKAGNRARKKIDAIKITHTKEKDDIVTETDLLVEKLIFNYIAKHFPDHGFDSEEMGNHAKGSDCIWVLDPIDGTKYYTKGLPLYSISLALEYKNNLIQGIVYIPGTGQLFCAGNGTRHGAFLNNKRIFCNFFQSFRQLIEIVGIFYSYKHCFEYSLERQIEHGRNH